MPVNCKKISAPLLKDVTIFFINLANICWSWRRLVLKTCLEDVLKTCLEDVLKAYLEDVLKTCLEDMSWRRQTSWRQTKCLLGISLSSKSKSVSDKSISHISISHISISHISISDKSKRIQNALIKTQQFQYSYLETRAFLFWELKSLTIAWLLWNQVKSNSTLQNRWGNKNEVLSNMLDKYIKWIIFFLLTKKFFHIRSPTDGETR